MPEENLSYKEKVKQNFIRIKNSQGFKKRQYSRRLFGFLVLLFGIPFIFIAKLIEDYFGINPYTGDLFALLSAIVFAVLISEKKANQKYGDE